MKLLCRDRDVFFEIDSLIELLSGATHGPHPLTETLIEGLKKVKAAALARMDGEEVNPRRLSLIETGMLEEI